MRSSSTSALLHAVVHRLLILAVLLLATSCTGDKENQPALVTPLRKVESGRPAAVLYRQKCAGCHGYYGAGDGVAIRMLTSRPRDWTPADAFKNYTDEALKKWIIEGSEVPEGRQRPMPAFGESLSDGEAADLITYIRAFAGKPIPERKR